MAKTEEIFEKDHAEYDSPPSPPPEKKTKPKRKLTEKQLANLAKGREKMAEKRRLKREQEKKEKEEKKKIVKDEKVAVKEIKTTKKEQKKKMNRLLKEQEKEQAFLSELKHREMMELKNKKLDNFQSIRTRYLLNCKTSKEYEELKNHLDTIEEDDVLDDMKLKNKLLNMISKYVKPHESKTQEPKEDENLKIVVEEKKI